MTILSTIDTSKVSAVSPSKMESQVGQMPDKTTSLLWRNTKPILGALRSKKENRLLYSIQAVQRSIREVQKFFIHLVSV